MYFSLGAIFQYYYYFIPLKNFFQFCLSGLPGLALCCFFSSFFFFFSLCKTLYFLEPGEVSDSSGS